MAVRPHDLYVSVLGDTYCIKESAIKVFCSRRPFLLYTIGLECVDTSNKVISPIKISSIGAVSKYLVFFKLIMKLNFENLLPYSN